MKSSLLLLVGCSLVAGCAREKREFRPPPAFAVATSDATMSFSPGGSSADQDDIESSQFLDNAYQLSQGKTLFQAMNCVGCHANGGGGMGPALMDRAWLYGSRFENVVASIRDGRPEGMPSFKAALTDDQLRELAGYVLSMSGNASSGAAPQRNDAMNAHPSESRTPQQSPGSSDTPHGAEPAQ